MQHHLHSKIGQWWLMEKGTLDNDLNLHSSVSSWEEKGNNKNINQMLAFCMGKRPVWLLCLWEKAKWKYMIPLYTWGYRPPHTHTWILLYEFQPNKKTASDHPFSGLTKIVLYKWSHRPHKMKGKGFNPALIRFNAICTIRAASLQCDKEENEARSHTHKSIELLQLGGLCFFLLLFADIIWIRVLHCRFEKTKRGKTLKECSG